jgi:spore germination cell wall hydrolase CwlJ-like protein
MIKYFRVGFLSICLFAVANVLYTVTTDKLAEMRAAMDLDNPIIITAKERERQLDCLALNIYREAGNEPFEGKVGVAQVTLNRTEHMQFPNDVCAVVYQKNKVVTKVICQFSWYCDSTHRNRPIHKEIYQESYVVAQKVLLEGFRLPSLEHALYYHADYVSPNWKLERITKIGRHIFYKPYEKRNA